MEHFKSKVKYFHKCMRRYYLIAGIEQLFVKTIPLCNQLPSEIAECFTIEAFKKQLKHYKD